MHRSLIGSCVALSASLAVGALARGATIAVNFTGGGNGSSPAVSLLPTDSAGVVPATNWNNEVGGNGTGLSLVDGTGTATTATLTYTSGGTYSSVGGATIAPAGGDEKLNTGFIYGNGTVTVTGIPYAFFDVYVYELNDGAGRVETTTLTTPAAGQGPFYGSAASPGDSGHVDQNATTPYIYTQSTSTTVGTPTPNGDYVQFTGLSGGTVSFSVSAPGNGYLNGFEIVQVPTPEPASLGLLGLGAFGLLARRRR